MSATIDRVDSDVCECCGEERPSEEFPIQGSSCAMCADCKGKYIDDFAAEYLGRQWAERLALETFWLFGPEGEEP